MHQGDLLHECLAIAPRGLLHVRRHDRQEAREFARGEVPAVLERPEPHRGGDFREFARGEVPAVLESRHHGVRRKSWWSGRRGRRLWGGGLRPHGGCKQGKQEEFHEVGSSYFNAKPLPYGRGSVVSVYRPMRRFTKSTVELAMGLTRAAPSRRMPGM